MSANGRVAVVTGAGTGIGKASALALLRDGYSVALAGRRVAPLEETASEAGDDGERTIIASTDVGDPKSVDALFEAVEREFGRLDVLFNNAGTGAPAVPLEDLTYEQWMTVVDANLTGTFLCTQRAFHIMKRQDPMGGRIINNGSLAAYVPRPNSIPYSATKHAVTGMTRATSLDGRKYDIACSQVDVGNAETPMTQRMHDGVPQAHGGTMAEPTMDVRHVADAIVYIANLPLDANVQFMSVMATKMPFIGRG